MRSPSSPEPRALARADPALEVYAAKRDFGRSPEPAPGAAASPGPSLTFVVQKHAARRLHYDFRLELDGVLKSWAVPRGPSLDPAVKRLAVMVEDHPVEYGSFEGNIPAGEYGAGHVVVWDNGTYSPDEGGALSFDDRAAASQRAREGLAKGKLSFTLRGEKLRGSWTLVKSKRAEADWLLIKHQDVFADPKADVLADDHSVLSGRTIEELRAAQNVGAAVSSPAKGNGRGAHNGPTATHQVATMNETNAPSTNATPAPTPSTWGGELAGLVRARPAPFPTAPLPMLPALATAPFSNPDWLFEPKLDGVRALALLRDGRVRLLARSGNDSTAQYPRLVNALQQRFTTEVILDGEIVAFGADGKPSFHQLAHRIHLKNPADIRAADASLPVVYFAFDVLYLDGYDLRSVPLEERKRLLQRLFDETPGSHTVTLLPHFDGDGDIAFRAAVDHGFEGVVAKRRTSLYESGRRSPRWLKIKGTTTDDFVIGGFSEGQGNRSDTFGALLVGNMAEDGRLIYAAHVGTGFDGAALRAMLAELRALRSDTCPFTELPPMKGATTWVRPELVAEVKFDQWTPEGRLRAPVFMRLRPDKSPQETQRFREGLVRTDVIDGQGPAADPDEEVPTNGQDGAAALENAQAHDGAHQLPATRVAGSSNGASPHELREAPAPWGAPPADVGTILEQLARPGARLMLEVEGQQIGLTNLDKPLWPATATERALTKRDLIAYYAAVSPYLLEHLRDRPLTLIRLPNGIEGQRFYQKHGEVLPDFVRTVRHYSKHVEGDQDYLLCNNLPTLLWLGQVAALELHSSYCRINPAPDAEHLSSAFAGSREGYLRSLLNFPDFIVFDLDPYIYAGTESPGEEPQLNRQAFAKTSETALWLKAILDSLGLSAFLKTTGRTGLHIFVPIRRDLDHDATRAFAESIVTHLSRAHPSDVTIAWSVPRRTGKVFADYNQNARAKTLASIYSPRGSAEASVSTPLAWDELGQVYPTDFTILNLPERLRRVGDLWAGILDAKHDLKALVGVAR